MLKQNQKFPLYLFAAAFIIIIFADFIIISLITKNAKKYEQQKLLRRATTLAASVIEENVKKLNGIPQDVYGDAYKKVYKQLLKVKKANADVKYIYLMAKKGENVIFIADADILTADDDSSPGVVYDEASEELVNSFKNKEPFIEGPLKDEWGNWVTGFAPVIDSNTGDVLAMAGMDIDATAFNYSVLKKTAFSVSVTAITTIFIFCILALLYKTKRNNHTLKNEIEKRLKAEKNLQDMISELKQAQDNMQQLNDKLEGTNQELQSFVYIASHDLREPLRKITSFGSLLKSSLADAISNDDAENLSFMIDGANRMTKMIEGLLTYSRLTTQADKTESVELNSLIEQIKKFELPILLEEKNAVINIPEPLPAVRADAVRIRQLFQNLICNGIKYQKPDTKPVITITAKQTDENMVRIEIKDNGIGIEEQYQKTIFEMFRRLHNRSQYEGTGIGLSVCKKIVEKYGGQIGVVSEKDKGATFWFTLPKSADTPATAVCC